MLEAGRKLRAEVVVRATFGDFGGERAGEGPRGWLGRFLSRPEGGRDAGRGSELAVLCSWL